MPLVKTETTALFNVRTSYNVLLVLILVTEYVSPATVNSLPIAYAEYLSNLLTLSCAIPIFAPSYIYSINCTVSISYPMRFAATVNLYSRVIAG